MELLKIPVSYVWLGLQSKKNWAPSWHTVLEPQKDTAIVALYTPWQCSCSLYHWHNHYKARWENQINYQSSQQDMSWAQP